MTLRAGLRESAGHVVWIFGVIEILLVAIDAIRRSSLEAITDVTGCTL